MIWYVYWMLLYYYSFGGISFYAGAYHKPYGYNLLAPWYYGISGVPWPLTIQLTPDELILFWFIRSLLYLPVGLCLGYFVGAGASWLEERGWNPRNRTIIQPSWRQTFASLCKWCISAKVIVAFVCSLLMPFVFRMILYSVWPYWLPLRCTRFLMIKYDTIVIMLLANHYRLYLKTY